MKLAKGERIFYIVNNMLLVACALIMLLPFLHVIAKSLSSDAYVLSGSVWLLPKGCSLDAYRFAVHNTPIMTAFANTVFITVAGTLLTVTVTAAAAYPLSLPQLRGRRMLIYFFVFTMLFNSGLIPAFLLMRNLGLLNKLWAMILPHVLEVYYLILYKNFFEGLPEAVRESAMMDGAGQIAIFAKIILPMSKAIFATIAVFAAVGYWNSYTNAMLYLSEPRKQTLQLFLVNIVKQANLTDSGTSEIIVQPDTVRSATVAIGTVPILIVYPFMQKHFVKGVTMGSVKG
jgi:putative aldouronate transport system permease protein